MPRSRARPSPRKTSAPGRYPPTRGEVAEAGGGGGRGGGERDRVAGRDRTAAATATNFRHGDGDIVPPALLHYRRSSLAPVHAGPRTLISSLYFDKLRDGTVLLRADGELTACFFGENGVPGARGVPAIICCGRLEHYVAYGLRRKMNLAFTLLSR